MHAALAAADRRAAIDVVYACGPLHDKPVGRACRPTGAAPMPKTSRRATAAGRGRLRPGDVVMVKGSLGSRMGPLVEALVAKYPPRGPRKLAAATEDRTACSITCALELDGPVPLLNVFRYLTFRTGPAIMTALFFVFLFGPAHDLAAASRSRAGASRSAPTGRAPRRRKAGHAHHGRADDPGRHPGRPRLLWADLANVYVWAVLFVTAGVRRHRLLRRLLKVTKQPRPRAFPAGCELSLECAIAGSPRSSPS